MQMKRTKLRLQLETSQPQSSSLLREWFVRFVFVSSNLVFLYFDMLPEINWLMNEDVEFVIQIG